MVDVLLGENVLIHTVDGIANNFPSSVGRDFKLNRIGLIVKEAIGAFQFYDLIPAQGQFFGCLHAALVIGVEHIGFFGRITTAGIDQGQPLFSSILMQHKDGESGIGQLDSLAGLGIYLDQFQVTFHFLIEDIVGQVAVAGFGHAAIGLAEEALRGSAVHREAKGVALEDILGNSGLDDQILAIGQASHPEHSFLIGKELAQAILVGRAGGHPAEAAAVGIVARFGQRRIVGIHQLGVALEHPGDGLGFLAEIILEGLAVIVVLAVSVQHTLHVVAAVRVAGELIRLTQIGNAVNGEARPLQFGRRTARTGGTDQLTEFKTALQHGIQTVLAFTDYIAGLIAIGQGFIVVDLIAKVPFGVTQIVAVIGFEAFRRSSFSNARILVFINIVGVFAIGLLQRRIFTGWFQFATQFRILTGDIELAVGIHRQHEPGGPFHQVVFAQVQVSEHQRPILDLGARHQMIFVKDRQVGIIPAAVGAYRGVPDGVAVLIGDLAVIHNTAHTVGVKDVFCRVQIINGPFDVGFAMRRSSFLISPFRCFWGEAQLIQIGFFQDDLAQNPVILEHIVLGNHGVAVLIVCEAGAVGHIGTAGILRLIIDGDGGFRAVAGQQLGAAGVAGDDVRVVVGVIQPNHCAVIGLGDFNSVSALAQRGTSITGLLNVRPVAIVAVRGFRFHDKEFAFVALGVVESTAGIELRTVVSAIGHGVGAVIIADNGILIVPAEGDIFLGHSIPFEHFVLCISCNLLAGLAVHFGDVDLQAPLIIAHEVVFGPIHGNRDRLAAAMLTVEEFKADRNDSFIKSEIDAGQFVFAAAIALSTMPWASARSCASALALALAAAASASA